MKVLDRYLTKQLLMPILYCSATLIFLILIADLFDHLDQFIRHKTPGPVYLQYYLSLIPFAFVQTIHWATWIGMLFLLIHLGIHHELIALKSAGLEIMAIIRPMLFLGFLIGMATFIIQDRVVPVTYKTATELRDVYIDKNKESFEGKVSQNVTYHSGDGHLYYFRELQPSSGTATDSIILWFHPDTGKTHQKATARSATYKDGKWHFDQLTEQQIDSRGRVLGEPTFHAKKTYPDLVVEPGDVVNASRDRIFLNYREMKKVTAKLKATVANVQPEEVDLQSRLASPWQSLVMMLMVVPLLGKTHTRKGIAISVLICVSLAFAYHVFGAVTIALGKSGKLFPFLSAWLGHIIFASIAFFNLDKANY